MEEQLELFPLNYRCTKCGEELPQPFYMKRVQGRMTIELPFCNEAEANEYALDLLRESGL